MRDVSYFHDEYEEADVEFLAVHVYTDHADAKEFIAGNRWKYRWLFADESALGAIGVTGMPTQVILDREGRVAWKSSLSTFASGADGLREALDAVVQ